MRRRAGRCWRDAVAVANVMQRCSHAWSPESRLGGSSSPARSPQACRSGSPPASAAWTGLTPNRPPARSACGQHLSGRSAPGRQARSWRTASHPGPASGVCARVCAHLRWCGWLCRRLALAADAWKEGKAPWLRGLEMPATLCWCRVPPEDRAHLGLQSVRDLAEEVGGADHGFRWAASGPWLELARLAAGAWATCRVRNSCGRGCRVACVITACR